MQHYFYFFNLHIIKKMKRVMHKLNYIKTEKMLCDY